MVTRKAFEAAIEDALNTAEAAREHPSQWIIGTLEDRGLIPSAKPTTPQRDPLSTKYSSQQKTTLASLRVGKCNGLPARTLTSLERMGLVDLLHFPTLTAKGAAVAFYLEHTASR